MQRPVDCKQSLRFARLLDLVNRPAFQRHRHRVRLVDAGVVKLSIDQNSDRD